MLSVAERRKERCDVLRRFTRMCRCNRGRVPEKTRDANAMVRMRYIPNVEDGELGIRSGAGLFYGNENVSFQGEELSMVAVGG